TFVEEGIAETATVDAWRIEIDRYLVSIGDLSPSLGPETDPVAIDSRYRVVDLAVPPSIGLGYMLDHFKLRAGTYSDVDFRIGAPLGDAERINVEPADLDLMRGQGFALLVTGRGVKDTQTVEFSWGFSTATRYVHCHGLARDITQGPQSMELTIRGQ